MAGSTAPAAAGLHHLLDAAEFTARAGDIGKAQAMLSDLVARHAADLTADRDLLVKALVVSLAALLPGAGALLINRRCGGGDWFAVGIEDLGHPDVGVIAWRIEGRHRCRLVFSNRLTAWTHGASVVRRVVSSLPLLAAYRSFDDLVAGTVHLNVEDIGRCPGLAFCDNRPDYFLIPDALFVQDGAYLNMRLAALESPVPWQDRLPIAFWRGGTSGRQRDPALGWRSLPRIELCQIGQAHRDLLDTGITEVAQMPDERATQEVLESGLIREFVPAKEFRRFRYQIDIDGNTNSWPGLFQKLLTGSTVLKVASPYNYRQWYYDRLRPWVNFVPVESNMSDLVEKVRWLRSHDDVARRIGENGQALALSLGYETEIAASCRTISAAIRYFAGEPELDVAVSDAVPPQLRLDEGWSAPRAGGLPTAGRMSRLDLPRPVATDAMVLDLEISPAPAAAQTAATAPPRRVTLVANGEIIRQAVVGSRQTLRCRLSLDALRAAERLTIVLLHPDADPANVLLHRLTLTPLRVYLRASGGDDAGLPPEPVRPSRAPPATELFGPDFCLPSDAPPRQVRTNWGTVLFADASSDRGKLRHGPAASSPRNVLMGQAGGKAYLFHVPRRGERYTIRLPAAPVAAAASAALPADRGFFQAFEIARAGPDHATLFGLLAGGLLLSAEDTGQLTLSRSALGPWERFELVEDD